MSEESRALSSENLPDAIRLMNESSVGTSLEWHLDFFSFLTLTRYWNISFEHTLLGYVDGEPASLIVNTTDPEIGEAYTFYWGSLPKFRTRRISLALFNISCKRLRDDGYVALHGDSIPDRPVRRYRFIQALPDRLLMDMQCTTPDLPAPDASIVVRPVSLEEISQAVLPPGESFHWCQRPNFLRNAASFVQLLGAYSGDVLKAYAVAFTQSETTGILDLRSPESSLAAGYELLRYLLSQNYRPPFVASYVLEHSYAHRVLTTVGFAVKRQFSSLFRDLRSTDHAKTGAG
jgi:hypothetical protein